MNYSKTTTITYNENNCVKKHGADIAAVGTKAMIVTGRNSARKCGALDDVITCLNEYNKQYVIFDEVEENPSVETVLKAADTGISEKIDFVIGIGGGSPLDASKAISIMICCREKGGEFLFETGDYDALPVICIPTTCGTGSEVTAVSVLTRHDLKTKVSMKKKLFPVLSLLDPGYLKSLSISGIRNTSIDAMGHMIESYINKGATKSSREYALKGLSTWSRIKNYLISDSDNAYECFYEDLVTASNCGGYAIVEPGTSMPHAMSYKLTYEYHVPHGMAIGIFQPAFMSLASKEDQDILLNTMGFESLDEFSEFIDKACFKPMFENYISADELKSIVDISLEMFMKETARIAKLTFDFDRELFYKNFKY